MLYRCTHMATERVERRGRQSAKLWASRRLPLSERKPDAGSKYLSVS